MSAWKAYVSSQRERYLAELKELVRIPSISALPEHSGDVVKAAEWVAQRLIQAGAENCVVLPTSGHPAVYADWLHAGDDQPTILIYGHFDVQPVDPLELWETPPFEPEVRDERLYGRGASDDKGSMLTAILGMEAVLKSEGKLPVNVKFCIEGEEEIGSPDMDAFLAAEKERFACDLVINADGGLWDEDRAAILLGLRGLCDIEVTVTGPKSDLHSGLHGGVLNNPIEALANLIATMRHADGSIAVAGFYDDVVELTAEQRQAINLIPRDDDKLKSELGISEFFGEPGYNSRERAWIRPTLELNGIWGGFQGKGTKTVIPSAAHAKFTCRLVADQEPKKVQQLVIDHIRKHTPPGVKVEIKASGSYAFPYLMSPDHSGNQLAAAILTELFDGNEPFQSYVGGSIPILTYFRQHLGADTVSYGWGCGDENLHAPNEFYRLKNFYRGIEGYGEILTRLKDWQPA